MMALEDMDLTRHRASRSGAKHGEEREAGGMKGEVCSGWLSC